MTLPDALAVAGPRGKVRLPGRYAVAAADLPALELTAAARLSTAWEACPEPTARRPVTLGDAIVAKWKAEAESARQPSPWTTATTDPPKTGPYLVCCRERSGGFRRLVSAHWHDRFGWTMAADYGDVTHWTPLPPMPDATA